MNAWVDACGDFPPPNQTVMPASGSYAMLKRRVAMASDDTQLPGHPFSRVSAGQHSWSVHDGQFFAAHLREKRPRAPVERRAAEEGIGDRAWRQRLEDGSAAVCSSAIDPASMQQQLMSQQQFRQQQQQLRRQHAAMMAADSFAAGGSYPAASANTMDVSPQYPSQPMVAPVLQSNVNIHQSLLDLMPHPIFVRGANGSVLYANRALTDVMGIPAGSVPAPWQVTPQLVGAPNPPAVSGPQDVEPEHDVPPEPVALNDAKPALPQISSGNAAILRLDSTRPSGLLSNLQRIPFWLSTDDGSHTQKAAVMYVHVQGDGVEHFFPVGGSS